MLDGSHDFDGLHRSESAHPVQDLRQAITSLIRQETDLARVTVTNEMRMGHSGLGGLGIAGWATLFAAAAASFSIILALGQAMDLWAAALVVAALFAAVAVAAVAAARVVSADVASRHRRLARLIGLSVSSPNGTAAPAANGVASDREVLITGRRTVPPGEDRRRGTLTLEGKAINVAFGGVRAVDGVSVRVSPGQRVGIVGANGAGKTTLFNALTGFVPLSGGEVRLGEDDISGWPSFARARHGIRRTFQQPRVADTLTVEQNIFCGYGNHETQERNDRADWLLEHFGLADRRGLPLAALPFGQRREVELIRALMRTPQVLMLDEPVSGLEDEEVEKLVSTLLQLQTDEGWGLVVIEHDLQFITHVAEHLMVMEDGRLLREGPLHAVLKEPEVRRVYLGELVDV
jgi:branched-chain amino acid transport system ATP-binding protein